MQLPNTVSSSEGAWPVGQVRNVCVVGGGFAGIVTTKVFRARGFTVTLYEKQSKLGGLWVDNYYGAAGQTDKALYEYPDKPYGKQASRFVTAQEIKDYMNEYAEEHSLLPFCRFGSTITSITRANPNSRWKVVAHTSSGENTTEIYDFVVMCTGSLGKPNIPKALQVGQGSFQGEVLHSSQWKSPEIFEGKRVVVVGNGKGSTDAVVGALASAQEVHQVIRTKHWYVPRDILGVLPAENALLVRASSCMLPHFHEPPTAMNRAIRFMFSPAIWLIFRFIEVIMMIHYRFPWNLLPETRIEYDTADLSSQVPKPEYFEAVRSGDVKVHISGVEKVGTDRVLLMNGEEIEADLVIAATGYTNATSLLSDDILQKLGEGSDGYWLYRNIIHPDVPNLAFVGTNVATFMNPCTHSLQATWLGKVLHGDFQVPDKKHMLADIHNVAQNRRACLGPSPLQSIQIQTRVIEYHDRLCRDMGFEPRQGGFFGFLKYWLMPALPRDYRNIVA